MRRFSGWGFILGVTLSFSALAKPLSFADQGPGAALRVIGRADAIVEGSGSKELYVFMDPNCPYCHKLFERTQIELKGSGVVVHWIVVAILRATSAGKAAAILGARDPLRALKANEAGFSRSGGGGAIAPVSPSGHMDWELHKNDELFAKTGADGVPAILYRSVSGQVVLVPGLPPTHSALRDLLKNVA